MESGGKQAVGAVEYNQDGRCYGHGKIESARVPAYGDDIMEQDVTTGTNGRCRWLLVGLDGRVEAKERGHQT